MKFPLHEDGRGSFQELAHKSDVEFGQLSLLTVNPNCTRGGHYHKRKKEWFCCVYGGCTMLTVNVKSGLKRCIEMNSGENKEFVLIEPYESHSVINLRDSICELLVIVNEEFDARDPDTFKYEGED